MPLLAVLDEGAHGALDDSLKTLYVQNTENKQFYLDIAPDEAAKVAFTLQAEVKKKEEATRLAHEAKKVAEAKAKAYESLGTDPEEIKARLESNRPEDVTKMVTEYEAKIKSLTESFEEPIKKAEAKAQKLEQQVHQTLTQNAIAKLRSDFDLNETADYVLRDFIKVVPREEGSDEFTVRVFENGQPALVAGQEMSPEQLIKGFQESKKFMPMFNAGAGGGTGASNRQNQTPAGAKTITVDQYNANFAQYSAAVGKGEITVVE